MTQELAQDNLALIWWVIAKYSSHLQSIGIDKEEAFSRGLVGLYNALRTDDITKGYKFSTWAIRFIKQSIFTPEGQKNHQSYVSRQLASIKQIIYQRSGRYITDEQLAKLTEMKKFDLINTLRPVFPLQYDSDGEILDIDASDYREKRPEEIAGLELDAANSVEIIQSVINDCDVLSDKERKIVKMFYGIDLPRRFSLVEISLLLNLLTKNMTILLNQILAKLSCNSKLRVLARA